MIKAFFKILNQQKRINNKTKIIIIIYNMEGDRNAVKVILIIIRVEVQMYRQVGTHIGNQA